MAPDMMQIGESFVGTGVNAAHVNTVLGTRSGPVGTAWSTALATPSQGHVPFVAVAAPSLPVQPMTLFVQKAQAGSDFHGKAIWGPAQAGVAGGVADAIQAGIIDSDVLHTLALIVAVWVDPGVGSLDEVYANNRLAVCRALEMGLNGGPHLAAVLEASVMPANPFYAAPELA